MKEQPLTVFYDGACPLCRFEIDALCRRDAGARVQAVHIAAPGFVAEQHGFAQRDLDAAIHVVSADGEVVRGAAALRRLYGAVGLAWLVAPTGWPFFDALSKLAYGAFARRRHRISSALAPLLALVSRSSARARR